MTVDEAEQLLRDVRARLAALVCELEAAEWTVAHAIAVDLENELDELAEAA